jgi:hypothetical protein
MTCAFAVPDESAMNAAAMAAAALALMLVAVVSDILPDQA